MKFFVKLSLKTTCSIKVEKRRHIIGDHPNNFSNANDNNRLFSRRLIQKRH
jgi:hypothetical protein